MKGDSNNSDCFKGSLDSNKEFMNKYERIDKLLKYVHARIEEKFRGFRQAFRSFDKDFGGSLDFKEFIIGLEGIGIRLKLEDCRLIFETLDFNNQGDIDFSKFCLLNTDRKIDWAKIVSTFLLLTRKNSVCFQRL
jgi:Ca2+-binding EF-hand superfamily protein